MSQLTSNTPENNSNKNFLSTFFSIEYLVAINSNKTQLKRKMNREMLGENILLHEILYNCPIVKTF